mmetsp:Transcript_4139/g.6154  ORF Transcript_4139/g.6154 Transcript_4139/m.6154 type:complete len:103 (-) Transcript_4139:2316-2624(-)
MNDTTKFLLDNSLAFNQLPNADFKTCATWANCMANLQEILGTTSPQTKEKHSQVLLQGMKDLDALLKDSLSSKLNARQLLSLNQSISQMIPNAPKDVQTYFR